MPGKHPIYRLLVRLYPKAFRDRYGADLVQAFDELAADSGTHVAWRRTAIDFARTVMRYRFDPAISGRRYSVGAVVAICVLVACSTLFLSLGFLAGVVATVVWLRLSAVRSRGYRRLPALAPEVRWLGIGLSLVAQLLLRSYGVGVWLGGGFVAGVVAASLWAIPRRQRSQAGRPLPVHRAAIYWPAMYWPGIGLMVGSLVLLSIFVMPYWFVGRNLATEIGAPPGYTQTDIDVRHPLSLALEYEPYLAINSYVRDQPATETEITHEITAWLADRGFDQTSNLAQVDYLFRTRSDQHDADLARFGIGRANNGAWPDDPLTPQDQTYAKLSISLNVADQDGLLIGGPSFWILLLAGSVLTLLSFIRRTHKLSPAPPATHGVTT